ncbi:hypothetical protein CPB86DRAFT_498159 [Serendipita vermifera]|nr:hypothetical protein CPB86DRAFT_498159 [Serendipita vermifera]
MRVSIEEQVKLRIGCLNQAHFVSQSIKDSASFHGDLISKGTANICDHLISYLAEELLLLPHDDAQDRINNLVCLAHLGQPFLESLPVRFHRWRSAPKSSNLTYRLACVGWIYSQNNHPYIHKILEA